MNPSFTLFPDHETETEPLLLKVVLYILKMQSIEPKPPCVLKSHSKSVIYLEFRIEIVKSGFHPLAQSTLAISTPPEEKVQ